MKTILGRWVVVALLVLAPGWAGAQLQSARLAGQLVSGEGSPISGAEITVAGTLLSSRTDSAGRFLLEALPAGQVRVQARALGFSPLDTTLTVQAGELHSATFRMVRNVQQLDPVVTEAVLPFGKPARYRHTAKFDEFYERRAKRPGTFFTREDIESSGRSSVMDLMSSVPGVRISSRSGNDFMRVARCDGNSIWGTNQADRTRVVEDRHRWLAVFINGQRMGADPFQALSELKAGDIETMEVYRGPTELPHMAIGNACAAVFITTRYTEGSVLRRN